MSALAMFPADFMRPPRPPKWVVVLALTLTGICLGIADLPCAGIFIASAIVVAATYD